MITASGWVSPSAVVPDSPLLHGRRLEGGPVCVPELGDEENAPIPSGADWVTGDGLVESWCVERRGMRVLIERE